MIGERLKTLREEKKLTQQEVAEKLGISRGRYSQYELNSRLPDYDLLIKIADFFGVTVDYLVGFTEKKDHRLKSVSPEMSKAIGILEKRTEMLDILLELIKGMSKEDFEGILKEQIDGLNSGDYNVMENLYKYRDRILEEKDKV